MIVLGDNKLIGHPLRNLWRAASASWERLFYSISAQLVAIIVCTSILALGVIGGLTAIRLNQGLQKQTDSLEHLSEQQLADRLDGEAKLARARLEAIGFETTKRALEIAQRSDVAKAVATRNDVTIREPLLAQLAKISNFDRIVAFDERGDVVGANVEINLIDSDSAFRASSLGTIVLNIVSDNTRPRRRGAAITMELEPGLLSVLGLPAGLSIAHVSIEPVFDDFGETVGALMVLRILAQKEHTLESFSILANAGVVVLLHNHIVSAAGPEKIELVDSQSNESIVLRSSTQSYITRCVGYVAEMRVCTFASRKMITAGRDRMFRLGVGEMDALMWQFLIVAILALGLLVIAFLWGVKRSTRGLSHLATTAITVAGGNIDVPFQATGVGEVRGLGLAFERMLDTLRESMRRIRRLAYFDTVTGLANREQVRIETEKLVESSGPGAFFFLDLDAFKSVNDSLGHTAGDQLLKMVADRLTAFMAEQPRDARGQGLLGRLGGDEFVAVLPFISSREHAAAFGAQLLDRLGEPFELETSHVTVGASVGITFFPQDGRNYEELLVNADLAMYEAKSSGRNTYVFFTPAIADRARERLTTERTLKTAIDVHELSVHYQPKISCKDGRVCGVEALTRWQSPILGCVSPDVFIKVAEESGLIRNLTRFVLEESFRDIKPLIKAGADIDLSVNVSTIEMEHPNFVMSIINLLERFDFAPTRLEFEITESMAMRNPQIVLERIAELRRRGIRFAIDDFGTGYSNLSKLVRMPFDTLKLDRSLIAGVATNSETLSIVRVALNLAKMLQVRSVVEGVENMDDFKVLVEEGADMAQGFLFSPAVPISEIQIILQPGILMEAFKPQRKNLRRAS